MSWLREHRLVAAIVVAGAVLVVGVAAWYLFAPKPEEVRAEVAPVGTAIKAGEFRDGDTFHKASGKVEILAVGGGHVLRFEGYDATSGPDVYLYLTPEPHASTTRGIEGEGVKIRTPTVMGHATLRGDFNVEIPAGVDVAKYSGVAIWCDTYNVLFGYAELAPV